MIAIKQFRMRFYVTDDGRAFVRAVIGTEEGDVEICDTEIDTSEIIIELEEDEVEVNVGRTGTC